MAKGEDEAFRMKVISQARLFKRSWVDMAEALVAVRNRRLYERWGYETLHGYALEELNVKRSTCDKLTGSYYALERHVPHVLQWDGVAQQVPEMEAVDYFAKAVEPRPPRDGEEAPPPPPEDVVDELKQAIFEDQVSTPSLRRRFNPVLHPKDESEVRRDLLNKVRSNARRLEALVSDVDGLDEDRVDRVTTCLEELRRDLDRLEGGAE
ncbi:MAG TPA: hypothetical protein RMH99_15515 [Sandaracinaceae bacterium LLY-WYZ-13_1]|nr:hypothetical protein [Sandaracinaceae bacterium LLY-WYZ-13_1]